LIATTASPNENVVELQAMSHDDDHDFDPAPEEQRLIREGDPTDIGNGSVTWRHEHDVDELALQSPGLFIWILTLSAGVSGLLFGYE
jgi:hypothetical protein